MRTRPHADNLAGSPLDAEAPLAPRALTLIELLVVVAIVGILIAIAAPALAKARERSKRSACLSNLHQTHLSFVCYAADFDDRVPLGYRSASKQFNSMIYSTTAGGQWVLFGLLAKGGYAPAPEVWYCPSEQNPKFQYRTVENPWPAAGPTVNIQAGYASRPEREIPDNLAAPPPSMKPPLLPRLSDFQQRAIFSDLTAAQNRVLMRHRDGLNVLYGDGSAQWVPLHQFTQPADLWPEPTLPPVATFNPTQDAIWNAFDRR
jgi:prepilin-type N-terminal cleavage/methylation domain-containing protein/prepilin-type processing-associated H-X9-DG protein